jgi:diguanylate cyclase (GGDEF)-like protein
MIRISSELKGFLLALAVLGLQLWRNDAVLFMFLPVFFITYLSFAYRPVALWFLSVYTVGSVIFHFFLDSSPESWLWPELFTLWCLFVVPYFVKDRYQKVKSDFDTLNGLKHIEFNESRALVEKLKKENGRIDKQLREIGHLYDVIKDLGSTLNAQEMLDLIKEFTDRSFDLSHFIIAVLSPDNKKYNVRVTSGCDEMFLRRAEIEVDTNQLLSVLAREKKPVLVSSVADDPRLEKLASLSIKAFLFIPFIIQDRVIGFLCSYSTDKEFLDAEKFANFQVFFNQIAIGLQKSLLYEKVQKLSITDGLTKLYSHRHFKQRLEEELVLAGRYSSPLSLLMMDIDHFKRYNDSYGHVAGDHVLMQVANILQEQAEVTQLVARYGGEEMVIIAPETTKDKAVELGERIRAKIAAYVFAVGQETTGVTISIGVATFPKDADSSTELISHADQALYAAKNQGRNRVVTYPV